MVIVGEKMWRGTTDEPLSGQKSDGEVIYTGRLEPEELHRVMGGALALTFVPWYEGFGIPVIEALAAGIPVLTSNATSLPEVGGKAAIYANPASIEEISAGMEKLATDSELRSRMIHAGLERSALFTWDKTARKVWLSIDTVLKAIQEYPGM